MGEQPHPEAGWRAWSRWARERREAQQGTAQGKLGRLREGADPKVILSEVEREERGG